MPFFSLYLSLSLFTDFCWEENRKKKDEKKLTIKKSMFQHIRPDLLILLFLLEAVLCKFGTIINGIPVPSLNHDLMSSESQ